MAGWHQKTYDGIIAKYKDQPRVKGETESHHIVPKSLGGGNEKNNLVNLPLRAHFVCHWLLTKMFAEPLPKSKMQHAFWVMCNRTNYCKSSAAYEIARKAFVAKNSLDQHYKIATGCHNFVGPDHPAKVAIREGSHHFQDSRLQSELGKKGGVKSRDRVANGTHHFCDGKAQSRIQQRVVAEGRHPFQGPEGNIKSWKDPTVREARCRNISLNKRLNAAQRRIAESRPRDGDEQLVLDLLAIKHKLPTPT